MNAPEDDPADDINDMTPEEFDAWLAECPLTPEEAQKAYDDAISIPLPPERIEEIVDFATGKKKQEGVSAPGGESV